MSIDHPQDEAGAPCCPSGGTTEAQEVLPPVQDGADSETVDGNTPAQDEGDCVIPPMGAPWQVAAASRPGKSHVEADIPCQDSSEYLVCPDTDALIAAVADGAGSAVHSQQGAQTATTAFIREAQVILAEGDSPCLAIEAAFSAARQAVVDLAEVAQTDTSDYATTLLAVIWTKEGLAAAQIGDGIIVVDDEVVIEPDKGEYANETTFITSEDAAPHMRVIDKPTDRLAMTTDGMQNLVVDYSGERPIPHGPFFDPLFQWLSEQDDEEQACARLGSFLESDRVRQRTHDDVTLLFAQWRPLSPNREETTSA